MSTDETAPATATETAWMPPHQPWCMGCGPENPATLGLRVRGQDGRVVGEATLRHKHEGAPGYAHGGAVATLLDDALVLVVRLNGLLGVTARLEIDYRAPVLLEVPLTVDAWEEADRDGRKLYLAASVRDADGKVLAEARGLFIVVDPSHFHAAAGGKAEPGRELPW
jgi:uncharacterized protein (TIGR00369 family)